MEPTPTPPPPPMPSRGQRFWHAMTAGNIPRMMAQQHEEQMAIQRANAGIGQPLPPPAPKALPTRSIIERPAKKPAPKKDMRKVML